MTPDAGMNSTFVFTRWVAAIVLLAPRVTVQVVVPAPALTIIRSLSTRTVQVPLVGKPAADATFNVDCTVVVTAAVSVVVTVSPLRGTTLVCVPSKL